MIFLKQCNNASDNVSTIRNIISNARKDKIKLTIFTTERINEWNIGCESLNNFLNDDYELKYLNDDEIEDLINLLKSNECLGHLKGLSYDERKKEFKKRAGRQLLVALHEVTLGKPYEDILVDEFNEIRPRLAQSIYLSVCVLNRLDVYVRAGIISRIYGVPFTEFKDKFFKPLEHVVHVTQKPNTGEHLYYARHSQIAEIVFQRILTDKTDRYNEYIRMVKELNITYSTDYKAFRRLVNGNMILKIFPDYQDANNIFKAAFDIAPNDWYLYHQRGIYEMKRPNGNLDKAYDYLIKAREINDNSTIVHSLSELARLRADNTDNKLGSLTNVVKSK